MRPTWMVQATVNEPLELLVSFVAHHLELGADLVHLYLDHPHPEAEAVFGGHPKVRITLCDAAYWAVITPRGRPLGHPSRQMMNARQAYQALEQDWLLMCDADEYVVTPQDLGMMLATQPAKLDYVRLKVAEKVLAPDQVPATIFDGTFRLGRPKGSSLAIEIYGLHLATMLERVVAGHDVGKSIVRRGGDFAMNLHLPMAHQPRTTDLTPPGAPVGEWLQDAYLVHYDALTPLHYLIKLLGKFVTRQLIEQIGRKPGQRHASREAQIAFAVAACAHPNPVAVTEVLHRLTPSSMAALRKYGLLVDLALAPDRTARKHFPNLSLDFTPEAFDRALRIKHAATLAAMGVA